MSALEDSLRKVYKLPALPKSQPSVPTETQMPMQKMQRPTMMRNPRMTMEIRDRNRNGIDDREEGMFKPGDFVPTGGRKCSGWAR